VAEFWDGKIILVMPDDPKYAIKKVWRCTLAGFSVNVVSGKFVSVQSTWSLVTVKSYLKRLALSRVNKGDFPGLIFIRFVCVCVCVCVFSG